MPEVVVGARRIGYQVRRSDRAKRKRIEVTPNAVEVFAPASASAEDIEAFVRSKRRRIHNQTEILAEEVARLRDDTPIGYHSGAKVLFRGRYLMLRVRKTDVEEPSLSYETRFHVAVPEGYTDEEQKKAVRRLLHEWFQERLIDDAWTFIRHHGQGEGRPLRGSGSRSRRPCGAVVVRTRYYDWTESSSGSRSPSSSTSSSTKSATSGIATTPISSGRW